MFSRNESTMIRSAIFLMSCVAPVLALDGQNPLQLTMRAGWKGFELLTQRDDILALSDPGYGNLATRGVYDGIGLYRQGAALHVALNHETSGAAISRVDLNWARLRQALQSTMDGGVTAFPASIASGIGYAYDVIYDANYHAINNPQPVAMGTLGVAQYGNAQFARFCSGSFFAANQFGWGRGFAEPVYLTGEEVADGHFYALDPVSRTLWDMPSAGLATWENAALVDTGTSSHVALVMNSDVSSGAGDYLRLYVGEKNVDANGDSQIDFLECNGLRGGTVYHFVPEAGASTTDLPDGTVAGTWSPSTTGALRETKLEDVHTNPRDGTEVVFGGAAGRRVYDAINAVRFLHRAGYYSFCCRHPTNCGRRCRTDRCPGQRQLVGQWTDLRAGGRRWQWRFRNR